MTDRTEVSRRTVTLVFISDPSSAGVFVEVPPSFRLIAVSLGTWPYEAPPHRFHLSFKYFPGMYLGRQFIRRRVRKAK